MPPVIPFFLFHGNVYQHPGRLSLVKKGGKVFFCHLPPFFVYLKGLLRQLVNGLIDKLIVAYLQEVLPYQLIVGQEQSQESFLRHALMRGLGGGRIPPSSTDIFSARCLMVSSLLSSSGIWATRGRSSLATASFPEGVERSHL